MNSCFFCKIKDKKSLIIWENKLLFAIYDINPVNPGHTLIIPKRHVVNLEGLSKGEWIDYKEGIRQLIKLNEKVNFKDVYKKFIKLNKTKESVWFCEKALRKPRINTRPDSYNYGVNDGNAAGRTVDHFHWHIIPRFKNDIKDPTGGVRNVIPEMGNYKVSRK